jgi:hypothetical protein
MNYLIKITGGGTKERIAEALRLIAAHILKENEPLEIEGGEYNDCTLRVDDYREED